MEPSGDEKKGPGSERLSKQGQALTKVAMKETYGDSPHLGDQYMERLLYREEARNTGSVSNGKRKVRMSLGEETVGPDEWMRALGSMRPPRA